MPTLSSIPVFTQRVPMQFICPDNQSLSLDGVNNPVIQNNPNNFFIQVGSVAKIDLGLNGTTYFRGDGEYAPFAITMSWDVLGYKDYLKLSALRSYFVYMITFRNVGYYGKLVFDGPKSVKGTGDAVSCTGTFYVLSPSDNGGAKAVNRLPNPSTYNVTHTTGVSPGYLPVGIPNYYWLTFSSIWGETDPYSVGSITAGSANLATTFTWHWPTSTAYVEKASLYVGSSSLPSSSMLLADVPNGMTPVWTDIVGFGGALVAKQPPINNTAYRGLWSNGIWQNEA
jgi:hypothetical protein